MPVKFKRVGSSRPLARHRLQFESEEGLDEVLGLERENGCIRFHSEHERNLVGRIVRVSRDRLLVDVDAAVEID